MKQGMNSDSSYVVQSMEAFNTDSFSEHSIFNLLPFAIYVCDVSGRLVQYNQQAVEIWGKTPEKGDTEESFWRSFRLFDSSARLLTAKEAPISICPDDQPARQAEMTIEREDGSRIAVQVNNVPIKDPAGKVIGTIHCFYDITEQKKMREEFDRKSKELEDYVGNAAIGLHWVDGNGFIKWANKAEMDMLGYSPEEYIGHHISEFHADTGKISDILERLSCNETLQSYEAPLRCKDGSIKLVQISSNVFREGGQFIHTRCFTIDVTHEKALFKALKNSEELYRQLVHGLQSAVYTTDAEGRITLYNKAAADLWGREPLIGKDMWCGSYKILNTDGTELPLDQCPMAVCLKEGRPVLGEEIVVIRPDGNRRHVAPHPTPLYDESGKIIGAVNLLVDVTDMKATEKALRESEAKLKKVAHSLEQAMEKKTEDLKQKNAQLQKSEENYHKMVEEVEDYAILLLDPTGIIQNWNKGAEKIKGYKEQEIVGQSFQVFYLPEDRKAGLPFKLLSAAREKGKALHEGWRMRKDGSRFWGSIVLTALHNEKGEVIGFSKVTRDLTERKIAEDRLHEYTNQLEFQNKELEEFTYAASHDLKSPLRKIHFYSDLIAEDKDNTLSENSLDYLRRSMASAQKMQDLIEDLLRYSKATSIDANFEQVDLNDLLHEVKLLYKEEMEQHNLQILADRLPVIRAIPFQIKQLFDNLINNSIKYKHPDRNPVIRITSHWVSGYEIGDPAAEPYRSYVKISLSDNGIGFASEYGGKIFRIFQRLNMIPHVKGSGIGLAICKKIVQNHKGFISASGQENEGAQFDIYLPANP